MRLSLIVASMLLVSSMCVAQEQGRAAVSKGSKTVTGCVAQGDTGYVLRLDNGKTYPIRSGSDLSSFMGKKVEMNVTWEQTGVTMATPVEQDTTPTAAGASAPSADTQHNFAGDLHLKIAGKVLGDCLPGKKK